MKNKKWNVATVDALMLSLITILYAILGTLLIPKGFLAVLLWIIKFVSTIWLLIYFIKDYAKESEVFTYKDGFGFAFLVSFLSSLFVGVYYYLHYAFIFPDDIQMVADTINQAMAARGGDTSVVDKIIDNFPQIMFLSNLIYLSLFGLIASSIIANFTKKGDVFTDNIQ